MLFFMLLNIFLGAFIYGFLKNLYKIFRMLPGSKSMQRITGIKRIGNREKDITERLLEKGEWIINNFISNYLTINQDKKKEIEQKLERVGSKDNYERYIIRTIIYPAAALAGGVLFSNFIGGLTGIKTIEYIFKGITLIASFMLIFEPRQKLNEKINKKDEKILLEMPRFIRTYRYSPETKSFSRIVRDYLKTAKEGLYYDLTVLEADIRMYDEIEALKRLANRVNIKEVREFTTVMINSIKGSKKDSDMNLYFIESRFQDKANYIIEKELNKRPDILDSINAVLLNAVALLILTPMAIHAFTGVKQIMK